MTFERILNELENFGLRNQDYQAAAEALQAAVDYFFEVAEGGESWTPDQLKSLKQRAGIDKALKLLAAATPADNESDEDE